MNDRGRLGGKKPASPSIDLLIKNNEARKHLSLVLAIVQICKTIVRPDRGNDKVWDQRMASASTSQMARCSESGPANQGRSFRA